MTSTLLRRPAVWGVVLSLAIIAALTLRPAEGGGPQVDPTCVLCGSRGSADLILNIILFLPLGAALQRLGVKPVLAAGLGLLASLCIEYSQTMIPGRSPSWRDAIVNGVGAGLGALLMLHGLAWLRSRRAPRFAWLSAAAGLLALAAGGWLVQPEVTWNGWYGQITPRFANLEPWSGRVDSVRVGSESVRHGIARTPRALQLAVEQHQPIVIHGAAGSGSGRLAAIFGISDDEYDEMLLVGQQREDLVVRERRRASTYRLLEPEFRFGGALAGLAPGTPLTLEVRFDVSSACVGVNGRTRCSPRLEATSLWIPLLWRRWLGYEGSPTRTLFGALTMLVLLLPVGAFAVSMSRRGQVALVACFALGTLAVTWANGLAAPTAWEWLGAAMGLAVGLLLGGSVRRATAAAPNGSGSADARQ